MVVNKDHGLKTMPYVGCKDGPMQGCSSELATDGTIKIHIRRVCSPPKPSSELQRDSSSIQTIESSTSNSSQMLVSQPVPSNNVIKKKVGRKKRETTDTASTVKRQQEINAAFHRKDP